MTEPPSKSAVFLSRVAIALLVALIVLGFAWYGSSPEVSERIWKNIVARPGGPMTFRFILQPTMAAIAALRDGVKDAREGRSPYFWTIVHVSGERAGRLNEGMISTARIVLLGIVMDAIYQYIELNTFYPGEAALIALLLAFIPYLLLRGPIARFERRRIAQRTST
jgi:hypothetical protein